MVKYEYQSRDWRIVKDRIKAAVNELLKREPDVKKVYLFGSYLKGYYADSNTPKGLEKLRRILFKPKVSDIDFMIDKKVIKQDFIIEYDGKYKVDYLTLSGNEQKLLVWDGTFLF